MTILSVVVVAVSLSVTLTVDPHVDNREVSVILTPDDPKRSDLWKTQTLEVKGGTLTARWTDLRPGTYAVQALLQRYPMDGSPAPQSEESRGLYLYAGVVAVGAD